MIGEERRSADHGFRDRALEQSASPTSGQLSSRRTLPKDMRPAAARYTGATMAGSMLGTVHYMAPEQARGEEVDQRADIYAMGLILYDMLLGRRRAENGRQRHRRARRAHEAAASVDQVGCARDPCCRRCDCVAMPRSRSRQTIPNNRRPGRGVGSAGREWRAAPGAARGRDASHGRDRGRAGFAREPAHGITSASSSHRLCTIRCPSS